MDIFAFDPESIFSFFLTLFRVSILVFLLPFFGGNVIPMQIKALLCLVLAWAVWPGLAFSGDLFPGHPVQILLMLLGEVALGLTLGLMVQFLFAAVRTGGELISFQMGFSMISVADPLTGVTSAVVSHFLYMTSLLVFLVLNGHLYLLQALAKSFELIPPGGIFLNAEAGKGMLYFAGQIYVLAVKVAAPVMVAIFLVELSLALIGRTAPQMNVLILGFPLKIAVGFLFLGVLFGTMAQYIEEYIHTMTPMFTNMLRTMSAP